MKKFHIIPIIFWVGFSLFIMTLSYKLGLGGIDNPGAGLMPFLLSLLLLLISIFFLISLFLKKGERYEIVKEDKVGLDFKKISLVCASLFVYALLLERLGYLITTSLLLILLFKSLGLKWRFVFITSGLTVLITYFLFTYLGVIFPSGIFEFLVFRR